MNATRLEPMNCFDLKSPNSTIGTRERVSMNPKATSAAAPPTKSPMISGEPQPQALPSIRARTMAVRPAVRVITPG